MSDKELAKSEEELEVEDKNPAIDIISMYREWQGDEKVDKALDQCKLLYDNFVSSANKDHFYELTRFLTDDKSIKAVLGVTFVNMPVFRVIFMNIIFGTFTVEYKSEKLSGATIEELVIKQKLRDGHVIIYREPKGSHYKKLSMIQNVQRTISLQPLM